jgi:excisionase family DNA binding protein
LKKGKKMEAHSTAEPHLPAEQWVSVGQIAHHLNVKAFTIYKWLERKDMPAHKVGRLWRFKISEIDQWVKSGGAAEENDNERRS